MKFESIAEVIEFAKEKEQDAADFYEEISKLEVFSGSRELLEGFAKEERKHYDLLDS
ncbi:MAG: rubrerythrin, partial [Deltaproteobacteria bacterium]|nr:rubrerythrin [Deltaproteobacteria bacterium]